MKKFYEIVFTDNNFKTFVRLNDDTVREVPYKVSIPKLYIKDENLKTSKFKSFTDGTPLREIQCHHTSHVFKILKGDDNVLYQYNLIEKTDDGRTIKHIPTHGNTNRVQCIIRENFGHQIGFRDEKIIEPRMWAIDIEVQSKGGYATPKNPFQSITLIQFFDLKDNKGYVLGLKDCE